MRDHLVHHSVEALAELDLRLSDLITKTTDIVPDLNWPESLVKLCIFLVRKFSKMREELRQFLLPDGRETVV